jgi:hypothetical protein
MNHKLILVPIFLVIAFLTACSPIENEKTTFLTEDRYAENIENLDVFFARHRWTEDYDADKQGNPKNTYYQEPGRNLWSYIRENKLEHIASIYAPYRGSFREKEYPEVERYLISQSRKIGGHIVFIYCASNTGQVTRIGYCKGEVYRKP